MTRSGLFLRSVGCVLLAAASAHADGASACVAASEAGLAARDRGQLREARKRFVVCAADVCPKTLRIDCARWLDEVEASLPTIVFGAKDAHGADVFDVTVFVDGERVVGHEEGKAVAIDPGQHVVRFERPRTKAVEQRILLRTGEHNRPILASFDAETTTPKDLPDKSATDRALPPSSEPSRSLPTASWVLGAIGLGALGSFAVFGLVGADEKSTLRSRCGTRCTDAEIVGLQTKYVIADVSLGVGLVALGIATYLWLTTNEPSRPAR